MLARFACNLALLLLMSSQLFAQLEYPGDVDILGSEEIIFDWSTDACETEDIPDTPARFFRDADGKIQLLDTHFRNYRMIGDDFDSLVRDCSNGMIMDSHESGNPADYNDHEWLIATYTTDGSNIHAIIHNEFQGHTHTDQVTCNSGSYSLCWFNALGYATSSDTGRSFTHATAPAHLLAATPYPYQGDVGPFGIFGGSNIVYNSTDGYYYCIVQMEAHGLQESGVSVIRTQDISDVSSWRGWDGTGYNSSFINPYTESGFDPADHILAPIGNGDIEKMNSSLTWNTYFNKWLLVGMAQKGGVWGFYYALSEDLISWTVRKLVMQGNVIVHAQSGSDVLAYPSIVDHNDTSRNFEVTGQEVYLYYTRWHAGTTYDRDLVRVPIRFNKLLVDGFEVTGAGDKEDSNIGDGICMTSAGKCSFRAAMEESNYRPPWYQDSTYAITFNISGSGPFTIDIENGAWQAFWYPVNIDGYTQSGAVPNSNDFNEGMNTQLMIDLNANGEPGLYFENNGNTIKGLAIRNTQGSALGFETSDNVIQGNFLQTNVTGTAAGDAGNGGITITSGSNNQIGGKNNADRNLILGGIRIDGPDATGNLVEGNYIGTDVTGTLKLDTWSTGVSINLAAQNNTVGGMDPLARNLISGNHSNGLVLWDSGTSGNLVLNNFIGTDRTGTQAIGNGLASIKISNGPEGNYIGKPGAGNVIVYGSDGGIWIDGSSRNFIQGNFIGTDTTGTLDLGNLGPGMYLMGQMEETHIGGADSGEANIIAYNNDGGIVFQGNVGSGIKIWNNAFFANDNRTGIDIGYDGATPNDDGDGDGGPNGTQNYPELTSAYTGDFLTINGTLNSTPSSAFRIEFFVNDVCDESGYGEGQTYLDAVQVNTDGSGNATFGFDLEFDIEAGKYITATASAPDNSTSEFSNCVQVLASSGQLAVSPAEVSSSVDIGDDATATLEISNIGNLPADWSLSWLQDWISADMTLGTLNAATTAEVSLVLHSANLDEGTHLDTLTVTSSQTGQDPLKIPVTLTVSTQPDIAVNPGSLEATTSQNGQVSRTLTISNEGSADLNFDVGTVHTATWMSVDIHSGTLSPGSSQDILVTANATDLEPGVHEGIVILTSNDPDEGALNISFYLTVTGEGPQIGVSPLNLQREVPSGGSSTAQVAISNVGTQALSWSLGGTPEWFQPASTSGSVDAGNTTQLDITFNASGLSATTYSDTMRIYSNDASTPEVKVPITLEVTAAVADFSVAPTTIQRTVPIGGQVTAELTLTNNSGGNITWNIPGLPNWLAVSSHDGTTNAGQTSTVNVIFNSEGLSAGSYSHTLQVLADGETYEVPVQMDVSAQQFPTIGVAHNSLVGTIMAGDSTEHQLGIWNEGQATLNWVIHWEADWIKIDPPLGNIEPGSGLDVKVTFITTQQMTGDYVDTLFVDSNDPNTPRRKVVAAMTVQGGQPGQPDIDVKPVSLAMTLMETSAFEYPVTFYNKGDASLSLQCSIAHTTSWMSIVPANGNVAPGDSLAAEVKFVLTGLSNGTYHDTLVVNSNDPDMPTGHIPIAVTLDSSEQPEPDIQMHPMSVDMTLSAAGPHKQTVTFYNKGTAGLHLECLFANTTPWMSMVPALGDIAPADSMITNMHFDMTGLNNGTYLDTLVVNSNDPDTPTATIPISVTLNAATSSVAGSGQTPEAFALLQNYPNPFNPTTRIAFALPEPAEIELAIFDISGRLVKTLAAGRKQTGRHEVIWDATNQQGAPVSSGVYIYRLDAKGKNGRFFNTSRKLVFMK